MAEPADLLRAWRDVIKQLGSIPTLPGQTELVRTLVAPLQRQAELLEETFQRQLRFEREVVGRVLEPVTVVFDALSQTATAMRTQAEAMQAAATALKQAGDLLELQATTFERMTTALRSPATFLRPGPRDDEDEDDEF
jgi:flagellar biosynthesis/type III secretory pathway ATPase